MKDYIYLDLNKSTRFFPKTTKNSVLLYANV